jgi:hypothetical protein
MTSRASRALSSLSIALSIASRTISRARTGAAAISTPQTPSAATRRR